MEAFPFTDSEWDPLKPVAESIIDAVLIDDEVLAASLRLDMLDLLADLRARHGDHPVLLETMADYTDDGAAAAVLYRRAADLAVANGLPTLSIRMAFAYTLMTLGDPAAALDELQACGGEAADGSEQERAGWVQRLGSAADYAEGDEDRPPVYQRAVAIAAGHGLPTLSIRLLLVRFLLDHGKLGAAREELRACRSEVPGASEDDRTWWAGLLEEASQEAEPGAAPDTAR